MRVVKRVVEYESRRELPFILVPVGDIHLGHINVEKKTLGRVLRFIEETPNCLWLGMGDYADAITIKDYRYNPDSVDREFETPQAQYREVERLFRPIAQKCLGLLDGNHDYKLWRKYQHNYVDDLAYHLGVTYLTMDAYIRLVFSRKSGKRAKKNQLNIYAHHGWTGARTSGAKINRIEDLAKIFPLCNLYLMGHMHDIGPSQPRVRLSVDRGLNVVDHEERFIQTGSFLRGYVDGTMGYVEEKTYMPAALGSPKISIWIDDTRPGTFRYSMEELR
ncbi:MAG: hypothetical protein ACE5Z5_12150 [Candidatus Bathyarchaeia archaeon]